MKKTSPQGKKVLRNMRVQIIQALKEQGAYLFYGAHTGSQYVKFKDPRIGSLRIGDHNGIEKYQYKWNLLLGGDRKTVQARTTAGKLVRREYYPFQMAQEMVSAIEAYALALEQRLGVYKEKNDPWAEQRTRTRDQLPKKTAKEKYSNE